jgi:hypothetical protein
MSGLIGGGAAGGVRDWERRRGRRCGRLGEAASERAEQLGEERMASHPTEWRRRGRVSVSGRRGGGGRGATPRCGVYAFGALGLGLGSHSEPKPQKHKPHNQASLPGRRRRAAPILIRVLSVATPSDATPSSPLPVALLTPTLPLPIAHTADHASSPNPSHRRPRRLRSSRSSPPALDPSNLLIHSISLPPRPDEGAREGVGGVQAASHPPIRLGQPATVQAAVAAELRQAASGHSRYAARLPKLLLLACDLSFLCE